MNEAECPREQDTVEAVLHGQQPPHALECPSCADAAAVILAIRNEAELASRQANVPPSGAVWWRIQRRAVREDVREAARMLTLVYTATLAGTVAVVLGLLGGSSMLQDVTFTLPPAGWTLLLPASVIICALVAPFAVYYAVTE